MKYAFYPGCALHATARPYAMSTNEIADALDVELPELEDWSCCGATVYQTLDEVSSLSLSGRNLALAEKNGSPDIVTPCAACFGVLRKADHRLTEDPDQRHQVNEALDETGLSYDGGVRVRHLLDVLIEDVGLDKIRSKVTESLDGLKVVCYYGCLMTRPPAVAGTARPRSRLACLATPRRWYAPPGGGSRAATGSTSTRPTPTSSGWHPRRPLSVSNSAARPHLCRA